MRPRARPQQGTMGDVKSDAVARSDVAVRFIRPDVALVHVTNQLSGLVSPDGQTQPPHQELSIRVLVKDQGTWRITAFHTIVQK